MDRLDPSALQVVGGFLTLVVLFVLREFASGALKKAGEEFWIWARHRGSGDQGAGSDPMTAQDLAITQSWPTPQRAPRVHAWLMTGRHACYLLAEARPMPQQFGDLRFDAMLLRNRAARARELAAAWSAVAEAWDDGRAIGPW